jgi:predicted NBD/HSP70 family sugar kinase
VKIRTDRLVGVVVDVHGQIAQHADGPDRLASIERSLEATDVDTLVDAVSTLVGELSALHPGFDQAIGLGAGLSGQVDWRQGEVRRSHRMGWDRPVRLAALLEDATGYRTMVEHDVKALALDEQFFGLGKGRRSFAVVTAGLVGIGAAFVIDYRLWRGFQETAGELGHIVVEPDGQPCPCGLRGCLETVAGSGGILRVLRDAGRSNIRDLGTASKLAQQGDEVALDAFRNAGELLGRSLSWLVNLLNLELVVVRAEEALRTSGVYFEAAERSFGRNGFYDAAQESELRILEHDDRLGARSAGSMVFQLLRGPLAESGEEDL